MGERVTKSPRWPDELTSIGLEHCSKEIEFISKKWAFRAPKGQTFQVNGAFAIDSVSPSSDYFSSPPHESRQMFLSGDKKDIFETYDFNEYLKRADGNKDAAFKMLEEDYGVTYPESFTGNWLIQDVNESGERTITIRGPVKAAVTSDTVAFDGAEYYTRYDEKEMWFFAETIYATWHQEFVTITNEECTVSLVDDHKSDTGFYLPPPDLHEGLFLPSQRHGSTFEDFFERHGDMLAYKNFGKTPDELNEDEKLWLLRAYRNIGQPFSDDPLADFKLPEKEPTIIIPRPAERPEIIGSAKTMANRALHFTANKSVLFPPTQQDTGFTLE